MTYNESEFCDWLSDASRCGTGTTCVATTTLHLSKGSLLNSKKN